MWADVPVPNATYTNSIGDALLMAHCRENR